MGKENFHKVEAWVGEVGLPTTKHSTNRRVIRRTPIEPLACLLEYPGVQVSRVSIRGRTLTIYRIWDDIWDTHSTTWTTSYERATRHARGNCNCNYATQAHLLARVNKRMT